MTAADVMSRSVITVREDQTVKELARVLLDHHITGAPVLDLEGNLVGVVSQTDLVRHERENGGTREVPAYHRDVDLGLGRHGFQIESPDDARVRDVMTPAVLSAEKRAPLAELARMMTRKGIHRLVITENGRLAGIVTSMDLLRLVAGAGRPGAKK